MTKFIISLSLALSFILAGTAPAGAENLLHQTTLETAPPQVERLEERG